MKQIFVVEGRHDEQKLKSISSSFECIVTGGSEISTETLELIKQTAKEHQVILFLDPDFPGKQISTKIIEYCGNENLLIASIAKQKAISSNKKKVGIEHATSEDILESLSHSHILNKEEKSLWTINDLIEFNLVNHENASKNRKVLCEELHIPYCNGKSLVKYLNMISYDKESLKEVIKWGK